MIDKDPNKISNELLSGAFTLELLKDFKVCLTRMNTLKEALEDLYVKHRGLWFMKDYGIEGEIPQMAFPVKFSDINQAG